jgi:hypothetical protein
MANLTGTPTYQAFIRQLETTDPKHPDTWNPNYQQLINNDAYLKQEIESNDSDIATLQGDMAALETSDPVEIKTAVGLDWLYNQNRIAFELFSTTYTLRDLQSAISGVITVNGDDSIDIDDTSDLDVGHEYVVTDGSSTITVVVAEIFSATRFRAEAAASVSMTDGELISTSFDLSGTRAEAEDEDLYFAHGVNLGNTSDAALIVRHSGVAGDIRLYYKDGDHATWTEACWRWTRSVDTGVLDVEYVLPARGYFDLKLVCEATSAIDIHHLVGVVADTGLEGTHHAPEKPVNQAPADSATDLQESPTVQGSAYNSVVGSTQQALQVQISTTDGDFSSPVYDSGTKPAGTSLSIPRGELGTDTTYYWRIRYQDGQETWSDWSDGTSFVTSASFEYIMSPSNVAPENGATDIPEQPTLSATDFETDGFEKTSLSDGTTDLWTDSGTTSGEYYYTGAALGAKPSAVYADDSLLTQGTLGSLSSGEWAWGDQDTLGADTVYIKTAAGDPDAQAADYIQAGEVHIASQWQIRESGGTYDAPVYESGEITDLTSHVVPAGNLEEGETTYYYRVRYKGENLGLSEWSSETGFTTKDQFASIYGIALVSTGGGAGTWQQIDGDGNNISPSVVNFNSHPVWGGMDAVTIDDQDMVTVPQFFVKTGIGPSGSDQAGKKCWWVSDAEVDGFDIHPAFMDTEVEIDQFYFGAYECSDGGSSKAASVSGAAPLVSIDFPTMQTRCENRNTGGVDGFQMLDIHQLSAVQLLALIELGTPDVQSAIANGNVSSSAAVNTGASDAVWRGIYEFWGNTRCMVDGLQIDGSHQVKVWDMVGNQSYQSTGITTTSTDGWPVSLHDESGTGFDLSLLFLPKTTTGTESAGTIADYLYASDAGEDNVCYHGGTWGYGSQAGLFYLVLSSEASFSSTSNGSRLAKR